MYLLPNVIYCLLIFNALFFRSLLCYSEWIRALHEKLDKMHALVPWYLYHYFGFMPFLSLRRSASAVWSICLVSLRC